MNVSSSSSIFGRLFGCKHAAKHLHAKDEHIVVPLDDEYETVTYRLYCTRCGADVNISHARPIGGLENLKRRIAAKIRS